MNLLNLIICIYVTTLNTNAFLELDLLNYDDEYKLNDFRKKFIMNRRQKILKNKRTDLLDKYLFNNTVYLDGIIHYEINENNTELGKIEDIEEEFRNILAMNGVKYVYKRGTKWRTWREILRDDGKEIVCYVCENIVKGNCSNCRGGGHWIIEETPPCPYEIFSVLNNNQICAKYYTEYSNLTNDCPSQIKYEDLGVSCDNPIETKWRIRRDYKNLNTFPAFICNGKEYCDVTTLYTVDSQGISFRLINTSNIIYYSRVMRNGGKNYACVDDCGYWDPNTKKIAAQQNPLSFDLLAKNKKKRQDIFNTSITSLDKSTEYLKKSTKLHKLKNKHGNNVKEKDMSMMKSAGIISISKPNGQFTTMSHCKKLEKTEKEEYDDDSGDE